jgi:hypothetical protein
VKYYLPLPIADIPRNVNPSIPLDRSFVAFVDISSASLARIHRYSRRDNIIDIRCPMKIRPTREIVVNPALDRTERLVRRALEEVNPDITGTQLEGNS